jgi:hypothetical protein
MGETEPAGRTLGVPCIAGVIRDNTSPNRPSAAEIDSDTRRTIEALTWADRRVSDFALAAFEATRHTGTDEIPMTARETMSP